MLGLSETKFSTSDEVRPLVKNSCEANSDVASFYNLGASEEGRPIDAVVLGRGDKNISLIAGAHSDEPVGPETLRTFVLKGIAQKGKLAP
ncbi:MAG: M14 family zinc carboxypeptidase, partial [bacterium]